MTDIGSIQLTHRDCCFGKSSVSSRNCGLEIVFMNLLALMSSPVDFVRKLRTENTAVFATPHRSISLSRSGGLKPSRTPDTDAYINRAKEMSREDDLAELNASLEMLAAVFPNIQYEVFREMLGIFSGNSRLQIITEQLLDHKDHYVKGRWRLPSQENNQGSFSALEKGSSIALVDTFRSESYKKAARRALCLEFKGLSRSTIDAVLAERNHSYTLCRPTLQIIAARSWRSNITAFLSRWRKSASDASRGHFMLVWVSKQGPTGPVEPTTKESGDLELDQELYTTILAPLISTARKKQYTEDRLLALNIHAKEAGDVGALFECECCFSDTTFEQITACTDGGHLICFRCLRNAVNEALFGQSWSQNIDHDRGQVRCLAPTAGEGCLGCVPESALQRAVCQEKGGKEVWNKLESRIAEQSFLKAQIPLVPCPFCPYAEYDELYLPPSTVHFGLSTSKPFRTFILLLLLLDLVPFLLLYSLFCRCASSFRLRRPCAFFHTSLSRLTRRKHLSRRFRCRSPTCGVASCLSCSKAWHDPHICHESATLSLRKTIEAARTAAVKRTCPRCGLGFIKESGCNKLTCVCGYVMCYICRQGLGRGEESGRYEHFCQHFRATGGKCVVCDKCDLYLGEDEAGAVARAGQLAEKEWREREGMVGVEGLGSGLQDGALARWRQGQWTLQDVVDCFVAELVTC